MYNLTFISRWIQIFLYAIPIFNCPLGSCIDKKQYKRLSLSLNAKILGSMTGGRLTEIHLIEIVFYHLIKTLIIS